MGPQKEIPDFLQAVKNSAPNTQQVSPFLGSDFVYNFLQKHPNLINSIGHKIDGAYINQLQNGAVQVNGTNAGYVSNNGNSFNSYMRVNYINDPRHPNYSYIGDGRSSFYGYLPTLGNYTLGPDNAQENYLNYFQK